jgi:hypothetical protein
MLIFGTKVKGTRVLQVWRKDDGLITGFPWKLDSEVPCIESDKGKLKVLGYDMVVCELVEPVDCVTEGASVSNMLPGESGQAS